MLPPLPERMRPTCLADYVGQEHLVGERCVLANMIASGCLSSFILWGPPGVGKTTLANIVAKTMDREFFTLSAVSAGVKDVRDVIDRAKAGSGLFPRGRHQSFSSMRSTGSTRRSRLRCLAPWSPVWSY